MSEEFNKMIIPVNYADFQAKTRKIYFNDNNDVAVTLGPGSYLVNGSLEFGSINCHVLIGRYCSLGHRLTFEIGLNHDYHQVTTYPFEDLLKQDSIKMNHADNVNHNQIIIGNDVWIGCDVTIFGGVRIGNGAVIGAGAVVAKDIPAYAVVVGNPARVIKYRFEENIIDKLQKIKWWNWNTEKINHNLKIMKNVEAFCEKFYIEDTITAYRNEISEKLYDLHQDNWIVYFMEIDVSAEQPLWESIIKQYINTFTSDEKIILLLGNPVCEASKKALATIKDELDVKGEKAPLISSIDYKNTDIPFSIIPYIDFYITNREDRSSIFIDYINDYGGQIISGLETDVFGTVGDKQISDNPLITIGVPTYNRSKYLKKCLSALAESVGGNGQFEVMISDNASTDDTADIVKKYTDKYKNFIYVRQENNVGATKNFQYLWRNANGKYVLLLGDDDYVTKESMLCLGGIVKKGIESSLIVLKNQDVSYQWCEYRGIDTYIKEVSFISTSIPCIVLKKSLLDVDEFENIIKKENLSKSRLQQVALQMEMLHKNDSFLCIVGNMLTADTGESVYISPEEYRKKGRKYGFPDLGRVFIQEYFDILVMYKKYGITDETIKCEKKKILYNFLFQWCQAISLECVRWNAKELLEIFDVYYAGECYYEKARSLLQENLSNVDPNIKEDYGDQGELFDKSKKKNFGKY